ncbi:MAG: cation:proton antiporter, partial [Candidatus Puniceispirillum sp.]
MIITLVSFAFFFGILISRVGLPPMVGFLAAGFAYNFAGLDAPDELQIVSDLGVTLLLFSIGLKLKLKDLAAAEVWGTSVTHVVASTLFFSVVIYLGQLLFSIPLFELSLLSIVTLAFGLSFSSTV